MQERNTGRKPPPSFSCPGRADGSPVSPAGQSRFGLQVQPERDGKPSAWVSVGPLPNGEQSMSQTSAWRFGMIRRHRFFGGLADHGLNAELALSPPGRGPSPGGEDPPTLTKEAEVIANNLASTPPSPNLVVNHSCFVQRSARATSLALMKSRPSLAIAPSLGNPDKNLMACQILAGRLARKTKLSG